MIRVLIGREKIDLDDGTPSDLNLVLFTPDHSSKQAEEHINGPRHR
jgi:hypothetical protein